MFISSTAEGKNLVVGPPSGPKATELQQVVIGKVNKFFEKNNDKNIPSQETSDNPTTKISSQSLIPGSRTISTHSLCLCDKPKLVETYLNLQYDKTLEMVCLFVCLSLCLFAFSAARREKKKKNQTKNNYYYFFLHPFPFR